MSCCCQLFQLTNEFQFDVRANNSQLGWSSTGGDHWERLGLPYSWEYFEVGFRFEVVPLLNSGLNQMTFRGPHQPWLFGDSVPWGCLTCYSAALQQPKGAAVVPCFAHPGPLPYAGFSVFFGKYRWEEHKPLEPQHPSADHVLLIVFLLQQRTVENQCL